MLANVFCAMSSMFVSTMFKYVKDAWSTLIVNMLANVSDCYVLHVITSHIENLQDAWSTQKIDSV